MSSLHQHPCPHCGWRWNCVCSDPSNEQILCFECGADSIAPGTDAPKRKPPAADESYFAALHRDDAVASAGHA